MKRWLLVVLPLLFSATAQAHTRSYSYSLWEMDQMPWALTVRINQYDLTRLQLHPQYSADYEQQVRALVQAQLQLSADDEPCELNLQTVRQTADGWVQVTGYPACRVTNRLTLSSQLLLEAVSRHLHFVTLRDASGQVTEKVLTEADNQWRIDSGAEAAPPQSLGNYWWLGVEHILSGWDHLAFVFGLLLLASSLGQLAWLITGFTLAHSLTLALAALGQVQPISAAVEAVIGLSILLVAVENVWEREGKPVWLPMLLIAALAVLAVAGGGSLPPLALAGIGLFAACYFRLLTVTTHAARWRLLIAFAFGLFHGFGFAGILSEMALPDQRLLSALFGFNLGVESGQLLVVALLWPLVHVLGRRLPVERLGTTAIAGLGTFWFITRVFA